MSGGGLVCLVGFGVQAFLGGEALTEEEDLRFEMVVTDDFAAWQASDAISDAERHFQSWVRSAAGSTPFAYRSGVALISGRVPGEAGRLVGYSTFEANADSARAGAEQSAVNQLHALYLRQIVDRLRGKRAPLYVRASERVTRELLPTLVGGRFREAVERSYGRVFRAAILFDADDATLTAIDQKVHVQVSQTLKARSKRLQSWYSRAYVAAGATLALFTLYALANALTKGYFAWRLRFGCIAVLGLVYVGIVLFHY